MLSEWSRVKYFIVILTEDSVHQFYHNLDPNSTVHYKSQYKVCKKMVDAVVRNKQIDWKEPMLLGQGRQEE